MLLIIFNKGTTMKNMNENNAQFFPDCHEIHYVTLNINNKVSFFICGQRCRAVKTFGKNYKK